MLDLFKLAEVELVYKSHVPADNRPTISSSKDAFHILYENWNKDKLELLEEAKMLLLNRRGGVLGIYNLSSGGLSATIVDSRLVYMAALKANAHSIILSHNHPSGMLSPSEQDLRLTNNIYKAGEIIGVQLLDHIIISNQGYYSFADEGKLGL